MFYKFDLFLLGKTLRLANWIDYRWHWNNYLVAARITQVAAFCSIATVVYIIAGNHFPMAFTVMIAIINPLLALLLIPQYKKLMGASKKWETNPGSIPTEAYSYILAPYITRLFGVFWAIVFMPWLSIALSIEHGPVLGITATMIQAWAFIDSIALYFASIPPSGRKRKEKKTFDWLPGITPQPVRN